MTKPKIPEGTPPVPKDAPARTDAKSPPSYEHEKGTPLGEDADA